MNLPPILLLRGVYLADLEQDEKPNPVIYSRDKSNDDNESNLRYSEIPGQFTSVETWPRATNLQCWHCSLIPGQTPAFIPRDVIVQPDGSLTCRPLGNFCDWSCAQAYCDTILKHEDPHHYIDTCNAIAIFAACFARGSSKTPLPDMTARDAPTRPTAARPKTLLKQYSGNSGMTRVEWRRQETSR
jgi:hypothetical protein